MLLDAFFFIINEPPNNTLAPHLFSGCGSGFSAALLTRNVVKRPLFSPVVVPDFQPRCLRAAWSNGHFYFRLWFRIFSRAAYVQRGQTATFISGSWFPPSRFSGRRGISGH